MRVHQMTILHLNRESLHSKQLFILKGTSKNSDFFVVVRRRRTQHRSV